MDKELTQLDLNRDQFRGNSFILYKGKAAGLSFAFLTIIHCKINIQRKGYRMKVRPMTSLFLERDPLPSNRH